MKIKIKLLLLFIIIIKKKNKHDFKFEYIYSLLPCIFYEYFLYLWPSVHVTFLLVVMNGGTVR